MKAFAAFSLVLALGLGLSACSQKDDQSKAPTTQPAASGASSSAAVASAKPINKYCAVEQSNPIDPKVPTVVYNGQVIGFCCEDCAPTFKKDPEKYMKTLK